MPSDTKKKNNPGDWRRQNPHLQNTTCVVLLQASRGLRFLAAPDQRFRTRAAGNGADFRLRELHRLRLRFRLHRFPSCGGLGSSELSCFCGPALHSRLRYGLLHLQLLRDAAWTFGGCFSHRLSWQSADLAHLAGLGVPLGARGQVHCVGKQTGRNHLAIQPPQCPKHSKNCSATRQLYGRRLAL